MLALTHNLFLKQSKPQSNVLNCSMMMFFLCGQKDPHINDSIKTYGTMTGKQGISNIAK